MTSTPPSPLEVLCDLADELVRSRGMIDAEVLLVLSDRAQQLGLPPQSVDAAVDSLSGRPAIIDAVPLGDANRFPTAAAHHHGPQPPPIAEELPIAMPLVPAPSQLPPVKATPNAKDDLPIAEPLPDAELPPAESTHKPAAKKPPKPPRKKPAQQFRRYLNAQLQARRGTQISPSQMEFLIAQGVKRTALSKFYAEDLLVEACRSHSILLPSTQPKTDDADVQSFADYCQQVLAVEGGVTPQARVKMDAKAEELNLTARQREQAVALLDTNLEPNRVERRLQSYEQFLTVAFASTKKVFPEAHQKLQRTGIEQFGLEPDAASRLINQVAKEHSVSVLTKESASELLDRSISAALDEATALDPADQEKLIQEGRRIGLTEDEVNHRIDAKIDANRDVARAKQKMDRLLVVSFACVLAVTSLAAVIGVLLFSQEKTEEPVTRSVTQRAEESSPEWWNAELMLAVAEAKRLIPEATSDLESLGSGITVARDKACRSLVQRYCLLLSQQASNHAINATKKTAGRFAPEDAAVESEAPKSNPNALAALESVLVHAYRVEPRPSVRRICAKNCLPRMLRPQTRRFAINHLKACSESCHWPKKY